MGIFGALLDDGMETFTRHMHERYPIAIHIGFSLGNSERSASDEFTLISLFIHDISKLCLSRMV